MRGGLHWDRQSCAKELTRARAGRLLGHLDRPASSVDSQYNKPVCERCGHLCVFLYIQVFGMTPFNVSERFRKSYEAARLR